MVLTVLGIESSCDDTAAAVLRGRDILSSVVWGQADLHAGFGGVVPEIAARAHAERLDLCIEAALELTGDNRASAAEMLGLSRQSLYVKLRRYALDDPSDVEND